MLFTNQKNQLLSSNCSLFKFPDSGCLTSLPCQVLTAVGSFTAVLLSANSYSKR